MASNLIEDITNSHYADPKGEFDANKEAYPGAVTQTVPNRGTGYSWMKAPRWYVGPGAKSAANVHSMEVGPFARMVVMNLIQNNVLYATSLSSTVMQTLIANGVGYDAYVKTNATGDGLDPAMIDPDIALGLAMDGLATVENAAGVDITATVAAMSHSALVAAYPTVTLKGAVPAWVLGLKGGASAMDRIRGRSLESLYLVQKMIGAPTKSASDVSFPSTVTAAGYNGASGWLGELKTANVVGNATFVQQGVSGRWQPRSWFRCRGGPAWRPHAPDHDRRRRHHRVPVRRPDHVERFAEGRLRHSWRDRGGHRGPGERVQVVARALQRHRHPVHGR